MLLLDISNNNEYIWTSSFTPNNYIQPNHPTSTSMAPSKTNDIQLDQPNTQLNTKANHSDIITSIIIGAIINAILLIVGIYLLYKWYKNKKERNNATLPNDATLPNNLIHNQA